jgi:hypothetical protein
MKQKNQIISDWLEKNGNPEIEKQVRDEGTEMLRASLLEQVNQLSDDEIITLYDNLSEFLNTKEK